MTAAPSTGAQAVPHVPPVGPGERVLRALGSMRLSVWLVLLLMLQVLLGTFAQSWLAIQDVQRDFFESWFVVGELPISFWGKPLWPDEFNQPWRLRIPIPGGYPVMLLLAVNLVVGGLVRIKWSARTAGILVTHIGILFLLVASFVKMHFSYAGMLGVFETPADGNLLPGRVYETSRIVSSYADELVLLVDRGDAIEERTVPEQQLWGARNDGIVTVSAEGLPFTVQVEHWVDHSRALPKGPMVRSLLPEVDGAFLQAATWPPGEQPQAEQEYSGCYVTVRPNSGEPLKAILRSTRREPFESSRYPWTFTVAGQRYGLDLRRVTLDLPFKIKLDKFQKRDHPGTLSPMDFRSYVTVRDGTSTQEAQIFMNNPLRRDGYVVFQSNWGPQPMGGPPWYSIFEVANNPSDLWPMLACFVIAAGLLLHFGMKLRRFLRSSAVTRAEV
ncbi:MAG: cytochrome c biogenesis protein ResB [Planctomycetes bacterium]|nr:cytochrome c biogenesis protein ResB [Planctomycetota bacterium]